MEVIDNFLKPNEFNKVKEILFHPNFEWYYEDHMVSTDHCFFNHCFYSHNKVRTDYFNDVEFILEKLNCVSLVSLRNNLVIGKKESYESEWHTDYNYKNCKTKIVIVCKKHGEFLQGHNEHLKSNGCPKCKNSKGEIKVENYLKENNINYETQFRIKECRNKKPLPFDFYLPDFNILIEYDGELHYKPYRKVEKSLEKFKRTQLHDNIKTQYCQKNNIKLLRIPYTEFNNIEEILSKQLKV